MARSTRSGSSPVHFVDARQQVRLDIEMLAAGLRALRFQDVATEFARGGIAVTSCVMTTPPRVGTMTVIPPVPRLGIAVPSSRHVRTSRRHRRG